jgi:hypothetical protein
VTAPRYPIIRRKGFDPVIDPLISLAHAIYSNKGVYAFLLGSGLSTSAGIPTGWQITLELIRRVAAAEGVKDDLAGEAAAAWFRSEKGGEPDYSGLLDGLAATPDERRAILDGFIVPTTEEIAAGTKVPTAAHHALARLVVGGWVRVIVTTNFDRLMETALREVGVEPTVIASADDALGAVPLTHAGCVIVKLHGDYLDTRIRNTAAELAAYPDDLSRYLDRILDEFGLIVVGWSAEWDIALRDAIARCPSRRFTTWWTTRSHLGDHAKQIVAQRGAQVIVINDADHFLTALEQKVLAIAEVDRPHPLSAKVAVAELKRYLLDPMQKIRQNDLVFGEVAVAIDRVISATKDVPFDVDEFRRRVGAYEAAFSIVRPMVSIGARWCREPDEAMWCEVVRRTCHTYRMTAGLITWIELQKYAPMLTFYAVGLGAIAGGNYRLLRRLFEVRVRLDDERPAVESLLPYTAYSDHLGPPVWNLLTAPQTSDTPTSDRILNILAEEVSELAGDRGDLEILFDRFEILAAVSYAYQKTSSTEDPRQTGPLFPPGRWVRHRGAFVYSRHTPISAWFAEAEAQGAKWPPLTAGMFGGNHIRFLQFRAAFENWFKAVRHRL